MKRFLIGILTFLMMFNVGSDYFADTVAGTIQAEEKPAVITMTLETALKNMNQDKQHPVTSTSATKRIEYLVKDDEIILNLNDALNNVELDNKSMQLLDQQVMLAKSQYYNALDQAVVAQAKIDGTDTAQRKRGLLNWRRKMDDLINLRYDRDQQLITTKNDLAKNYIDALLLQSDKEDIDKEIANLDKTIQQVKTKIKLGLLKNSDLYSYDANRVTLVGQSNTTSRQLESLLLEIKKALNITTTQKIILTPIEIPYNQYNDMVVGESIEKKAAKNFDYDKLNRDLELTKLELYIEKNYYDQAVSTNADDLEVSILEKQSTLDLAKVNMEASLWNAYYNIKNLEDNVAIESINLDISKTNLNTIKEKVKIGKLISMDELSASLNLSKQENKLQSAINEYMYYQNDFIKQLNNP